MKKTSVLGLAFLFMLKIFGTEVLAVDETKSYGRVNVTVLDAKEKNEVLLTDDAKPAPHRTVIVHLDANTACEAVVVAFSKPTGALVNGWRPLLLALEPWEARTVPLANEPWEWTQASESFEIFTVFLPKGMEGTEKIRDLAAKLRDPNTSPAVAKLQARLLREELSKWSAATTPTLPENAPAKIGGTVRAGDEFPWRDQARKLGFSETKPTVTVFRHGGK